MGARPLVSVITPFLNEEKFLREAIESVFAQTYENWELLLIDDGSADRSTEIAKEYSKHHPDKVLYLEHEGHKNKGTSMSRNLGLAHAQGDLIAYIDGDDVWLPEKLEKQVKILEQNPDAGLALNPVYYWYEDGRKEPQRIKLSPGIYARGSWFNSLMEDISNFGSTCGMLIRKTVLVNVGGSEESFTGFFEDTVLWLKISIQTAIYYDADYVSLYRLHRESITGSASYKTQMLHLIRLYDWLTRYLKKHETMRSDPFSIKSELLLTLVRHCGATQQHETIAALSYLLEPLMPELLKDPEWNYFTAAVFQYLPISLEEALRRYNIAIKYGFDESGNHLQYGFDEFDPRVNRGIIHAKFGNIAEARADLQRALELKPERQDIRELLEKLPSI